MRNKNKIGLTFRRKGGIGSGHRGHKGRPGKVGGSIPGRGGGISTQEAYNKLDKLKPNTKAYALSEDPIAPTFRFDPDGHETILNSDDSTERTETVPLSKLVATEGNIHRPGIKKYIRNPKRKRKVALIKRGNSYYIGDGHHVLTAMKLLGLNSVDATVTDYKRGTFNPGY